VTPFVLAIQQPGTGFRLASIERTPFVVGRSPSASLRLEGPGIWDQHLTLDVVKGEGLVATVWEGALARIGGVPFTRQALRNGDELSVGDVVLRLQLGAVTRRSLRIWGALVCLLGVGVVIAEVFVGWLLLR
jgi:hypothetical protein